MLCVLAHQEPGVQALEAQALQLTTNPEARTPEDNHNSPFTKSSTWTGLVDLDNAEENSLAKTNNSSEISEEHIVIHLQPVEDLEEDQVGPMTTQPIMDGGQESEVTKSSSVSGPANLSSLENHRGSAHEEKENGGSLNPSDTPTSSSVAPGTPQHQSSNNVLAEFVKSLMMPFRYLTGAEKAEKKQKGTLQVEEKAGENHTQEEETSSRNLNVPKAARKKGSVDNAIIERKSDGFDFWAPTAGASNPDEGLSEREKEVPLVPLVPAVPRAGQGDSKTGASSPTSSIDGKNPVCVLLWLYFTAKTAN